MVAVVPKSYRLRIHITIYKHGRYVKVRAIVAEACDNYHNTDDREIDTNEASSRKIKESLAKMTHR